jgi:hypothetical protein
MVVLHVLSLVLGTLLALAVLGSALKTVVLPQEGFTRLSQAVVACVYRLLVHRWRTSDRTDQLQDIYAPVALVSLPLVWMILMAIAFTLVFWGTGGVGLSKSFEISGSSLTTLGFSEPDTIARIWLAFVEATIGLGLVALLISYLPTIYSAYNGREKGIIRLRPLAGAPPTAPDLLVGLHRIGALDSTDFWKNQSEWILDLEQTHTSFPILSYFPETRREHSWVATVGTLLDAAALVASASETGIGQVYQESDKGPLMILVYGMPGFVRIARAASLPLSEPQQMTDLFASATEHPPAISISRDEYFTAMGSLSAFIEIAPGRDEACWRRFALIRSSYEPALRSLAGLTRAAPALWTTDRPAVVGKPRFLRRRPIEIDWSANLVHPSLTGD